MCDCIQICNGLTLNNPTLCESFKNMYIKGDDENVQSVKP